ncbi:FBD-associated F-box protein At3g52670 [Vigna radiata var. radiata]|uniref:FBD-associated F-box protein At3g52670 n=1 Tax=Vigna radiata var. radiata TaxID=3916 RepID=A0A1S3VGL8_VIGRR|nr:FBD-associated F-box protein At3g52670 [Vigna radiata var. radiata]
MVDDIISSFPDEILCHILSFLPTKHVVATSVLSKRWKFLWRSLPFFDFHYDGDLFDYDRNNENYSHFLHSVDSFLLSRDKDQPLHRFRLRSDSTYGHPVSIQRWITAAVSRSVRHLDLYLDWGFVLPSVVFSCKTLVVLKLTFIQVENTFSVDLPLLKILHLDNISSPEGLDLSQLLSGCPNLEDLEVKGFISTTKGKVIRLPKLIRASIHEDLLPLEVVKDVEVLFLDSKYQQILDFDFQNLVRLELILQHSKDWLGVLEVLEHCPKLQTLLICIYKSSFDTFLAGHEEVVWSYPQSVPVCISSHLKTCSLKYYSGSIDEIQFASYIMGNATYLRSMNVCIDSESHFTFGEKLHMERELSSCMKSSDICTLSFKYSS